MRLRALNEKMKNVTCIFCDTVFVGCSSFRVFVHILGRSVLDQKKSNVKPCIPMHKDGDNKYAEFKNAQKVLNKEMTSKEAQLSFSKAKQSILDLTPRGKRNVARELKTVESKTLDTTIACFFYENALSFNVADSPSFAAMVDQRIQFGQQILDENIMH